MRGISRTPRGAGRQRRTRLVFGSSRRGGLPLLAGSLLLTSAVIAPAEEATAPGLEPVCEEAFEAISRFYRYDRSVPLDARVVQRKESDEGTREKIVFRGARSFLVPGYIEVPAKVERPLPVVLLLHGWSGSKESWWKDGGYISGGNLRKALLAAGHAVFALDAQTHGDRIAENDYALVNDHREDGKPTHRNRFTYEEITTQTVVDYRRGLDYLESREDIDASRVGLAGYSMGGNQAFLLTAVEPRIRAAVACVVPSMAGDANAISPKDYARGVGDRPFLMLMGREDSMCQEIHARQLFSFIPAADKKLVFYEAGHKLPVAWVEDARVWIESRLGVARAAE